MGAYAMHAKYDVRKTTASARSAFLARFEREVDPEGLLPPVERARRADTARRSYFTKLALASSRARSKRAAGQRGKR
jgi:hypothetical protein